MKKSAGIKQKKTDRNTITKTLSFPQFIVDLGDEMAKRDHRTFSNYVAVLIEKDAREAQAA